MLVKLHGPGQICAGGCSPPSHPQKEGEGGTAGMTLRSSTAHFPVTCLFQQLHSLKFPSLSIMLWNYESVSVWLSSWRHRPHDELFSKNRTSKHYLHRGPSPLCVSFQGDTASSNRNRCCLLFVPPLARTPLEPRMRLPCLGAQIGCSTNSPPSRDGEWFKFPTRQGLLIQSALWTTVFA